MSKITNWLEHYCAIKKAIDEGFEIIWSTDQTLLLDLDGEAARGTYESNKAQIFKLFSASEVNRWESKTPGNLHVVVKLKEPMMAHARIILEMFLGSDPQRGLFQLMDTLNPANASVLFKPKGK